VKYSFLSLCIFLSFQGFSQKNNVTSSVDINFFSGNIARHNDNITHLIKGHPNGFILAWNKQVSGKKAWHRVYNYPEYGFSVGTQNFNNTELGESYGVFAHYNFYFLNKRLMFRFAQGVSYATNPYDINFNPKNNAFGSHLLSGTYIMLNYSKAKLVGPVGIQLGLTLLHLSNASIKSPNTSINTLAFNVGLSTNISESFNKKEEVNELIDRSIGYGFIFKTGINQSDVVGSDQFPFYIFSVFTEKRLSTNSTLMLGLDYFNSKFLKEYIYYQSIAYPENNIEPNLDYKRIGVYFGHELLFGRFSIQTQLGYYVYAPFDFEGPIYNRIGFKQYLSKNIFTNISLKSHAAKAEALEVGIGIRL